MNRISAIAGSASETFKYDGDGERVYKSYGAIFWRLPGGPFLSKASLSGTINSEHIYFGGRHIAIVNGTTPFYLFPDHLGGEHIVTNASGTICNDVDTLPFGGEIDYTASCGPSYIFAGMDRGNENSSDLDYDIKRYYDLRVGRFMETDPKQFSLRTLTNPQKWNKYAYVLNNPLALIDPNGMEEVTIQVNALIQRSSVGGFRGDNRGFSSNMNTGAQHSRVSVTMRIETDPAKNHGNPLLGKPEVQVGTTHFNLTGTERTSTGPKMPEVTATQDKNGNVNLNLQESMRNPLTPPGTGSIQTNLNISVNQGATQAEVSGTISGSPSFETNFSVDGGDSLNVPLQTEPSSTLGFALGLQETNNIDQKVNLPPPPPKCSDKPNCSQ